MALEEMVRQKADEVILEAEVTNTGALKLYENLGFLRDKRLYRYVPILLTLGLASVNEMTAAPAEQKVVFRNPIRRLSGPCFSPCLQ